MCCEPLNYLTIFTRYIFKDNSHPNKPIFIKNNINRIKLKNSKKHNKLKRQVVNKTINKNFLKNI